MTLYKILSQSRSTNTEKDINNKRKTKVKPNGTLETELLFILNDKLRVQFNNLQVSQSKAEILPFYLIKYSICKQSAFGGGFA